MGLSFLSIPANNGQGPYNIAALDFDDPTTLGVTVAGAPATVDVDASLQTLTILTPTVAAGDDILVQRVTPRLEADLPVDFSALTVVSAADMNRAYRHLMLIAQEAQDQLEETLDIDGIRLNAGGQWDAEGLRMENLADGSLPQDAATKAQLDVADAGARLLPTVDAGDNDSGLAVFSGEWAVRTPAQLRDHWGLGTAALEAAGTGADEVLQLNGSGQYPANDGQLIDLTSHPLTAEVALREEALGLSMFDPTVSTISTLATDDDWPQTSTTKIPMNLAGRTETGINVVPATPSEDIFLNASGVQLAQGTWHIKWAFDFGNRTSIMDREGNTAFAITTLEDSASQTVFFQTIPYFSLDFPGAATPTRTTLSGEIIVSNPDSSKRTLVFRAAGFVTTSTSIFLRSLVIQQIKSTPTADAFQLTS